MNLKDYCVVETNKGFYPQRRVWRFFWVKLRRGPLNSLEIAESVCRADRNLRSIPKELPIRIVHPVRDKERG